MMSDVKYYTADGEPIGKIEDVTTIIDEPQDVPSITMTDGTVTITLELSRKSRRLWADVLGIAPKYNRTEWIMPRKKKRGTIRRRRKVEEW